ncbi:Sas10 C-terminal domain-containing protein [Cantharellus anzutake]|uniref:Sas10 C-terminal domain-containing protein n=1 Tax=Cantharellus anzutake TaxID=1750568 RepID=UPI0019063F0B|nr:Sas10 C-terminal domain-containing protein [Cantharellus anzutake]KAF8339980.1 Sas10 C-terminal domain-containing protein [Cantharellus anzutake]
MKEFEGDNDDEEEEEYYDNGEEDDEGDEVEEEEDYASSSGAGPSKSKSGKPNASKRHPGKGEPEEESNSGEERWGKKSEYYVSAATDDIDSDDEEALALELNECRRLQKKAREGISEDDFGIEEVLDAIERGQDSSAEAHAQDTQDVTLIPQNKESLLRHLEKTSPEALALGREWEDVSQNLRKVESAIARQTSEDENDPRLALVHLHHQSLLSYASVLAYYFYVRSTPVSGPTSDSPTYAKDVPQKVIDRLWQLKNALSILEDLGFSAIDDDDDDDVLGSQISEDDAQLGAKHHLSEQEIQALIAEMEKNKSTIDARNDAHKQRLRRARERQAASSIPDGVKNKSKVVAKSPPPKPKIAYDLEESEFIPSEPSKPSGPSNPHPSSPPIEEDLSAFGEATSLDPHIAKEKAARKNALQFYTAKIERGQRRREGKRRHALTGDDDVPYQNTKERQSSKKPAVGGMELGGDDPHPGAPSDASGVDTLNSKKRGRDSTDGGAVNADVDGDEHHELVKRQKRESKENKRAEVEARAEPQRSVPDEQGPDSKPRSATTAILKNYGLTPKRSNADRNPRLRKRHQYEKAKKRVAHKKTTYKGGLASLPGGRYDGEKTGITKTVKSIKFT